jgi:anthranilate synthase component 1
VVHVDAEQTGGLDQANARLDELQHKLTMPTPQLPEAKTSSDDLSEASFKSSFGQEAFLKSVDKIKDYIMAGDAMQVVPSQRLSAPFTASPLNLYRSLRRLNPSPYMFFLNLDDFHIVGSSPEVLARLEDGQVTVRPIAGTRRRGKTAEEDLALEKDMLDDPKEIAEHLMLIDLGRNDVGRISQSGSVEVTEKMVVERYSHVMHITSNVVGEVTDNMGPIEVLKATLPAGTLSGAPKIRAMEIIDEVEPVKRGIYGGAVGYIGWNGNMDTAIAIRTAVIKDDVLHVQAGAGVVADSQPELEWKETMNKARAVMRAAAMVSAEVEK